MRRLAFTWLVLLVGVLSGCESASLTPTARPVATPTSIAQSTLDCTRAQIKQLVDDFFDAYDQNDLARLLSLFNFTSEFQYHDDVGGQVNDLGERASLERYLQSRFAVQDHFTVSAVGLPTQDVVPFCATNPTVAFTRADASRQYNGNAKLVISSGKLKSVVMSSTLVVNSPSAATPTSIATTVGLAELTLPTPQPVHFWANDEPKELPPLAFGVLDPDSRQAGATTGTLRPPELNAPPFNAPRELDVYLVGDYPPNHCTVLLNIVKSLQEWICVPLYSLVQYTPARPLGEKMVTVTKETIEQRAVQLLHEHGLLMPDQAMPKATGLSRVFFFQRINGIPTYANKNLAVAFNQDGQATNIIGRRRPLLARSRYPLRTPEQAWQWLTEGKRRGFYVDTGYEPVQPLVVTSEPINRFVAIELAYVEGEVINPQDIMQPYYIFRGEQGQALFVPAVADPYVQWR